MSEFIFADLGTRHVLEALPDAVLLIDQQGTIRFANAITEQLFGYAASTLVGSPVESLLPERFRHGHIARRQAYTTQPHRREMGSGLGLLGLRRDGAEFPVDISLSPFDTARGRMFCAVLRDMTQQQRQEAALRASEERFALAVRGSSDGIWDWNVLTGEVYYSPRFKELLDYSDAEFPNVFASFESHLHPDDHAPTMASVRDHLERRVPYDVEYRLYSKSGAYRWFRARGQALWDATGQATRMAGSITDIADRKQAIAAIEEAREAAESANRAKSDFLANMSHEIRTPLNAIIGMTELVLQAELKPLQREHLTTVLESGESLLSIINEILDFARIEAGKLDLVEIEVEFRETLGDILKSLAFRAHCKNLELAWQVAPDVPQFLQADPVRLRQIIVNLVGNAVKFTEEGEVVVAVTCAPHAEGWIVLHVAVSDTGIGIPADKLTSIFDAFEQADTSTTRQFGGTGLGLAIASTLVRLMQGRIWVESVLRRGSTFHFTLPLRIVAQPSAPRALADASSLRGIAAVVVDDNVTNRQILEHTLAGWGMQVQCVGDGAEALLLLRQRLQAGFPVRLLLTDINMPKMDGFMLAQQIRQDSALAGTLIVALTSGIRADDVERCEQTGIAAHLMKPVKQTELQNTLLAVLTAGGAVRPAVRDAGAAAVPTTPGRSLRILLVEDGVTNRKLAVSLLERRGHVLAVAEDGQQAVERFERETFDVILMDVQMPVMDGLEATRAIRRREQSSGTRTPIIAMTAHALKGDRERCLEAGMDGYLAKPVRAKELYETIDAVMAEFAAGKTGPHFTGG